MRDPPLIQDLLDAKAILLEILRRRHNAGGILFGREGGGQWWDSGGQEAGYPKISMVSRVSDGMTVGAEFLAETSYWYQ